MNKNLIYWYSQKDLWRNFMNKKKLYEKLKNKSKNFQTNLKFKMKLHQGKIFLSSFLSSHWNSKKKTSIKNFVHANKQERCNIYVEKMLKEGNTFTHLILRIMLEKSNHVSLLN